MVYGRRDAKRWQSVRLRFRSPRLRPACRNDGAFVSERRSDRNFKNAWFAHGILDKADWREPVLLVLSIDLVDHAQGGVAHDRKAELFGILAGDGSYYGLEPVDLPARHPVVRLGRAL